jgi:lysophospholipase L1-like esterase
VNGTYVALGSSFAAGPGIKPRVPGSPRRAGRSARNYAGRVSEALEIDLIDVTYSGATTANILRDSQNGSPPQIEALDGPGASTVLVTITVGGNDVGYVPLLMAASLPGVLRRVPAVRALLDPAARDAALAGLGAELRAIGEAVRDRAPQATVCFVDYLTLLPPPGEPAPRLSDEHIRLGRHVADRLAAETAAAAAATGCVLVSASAAGRSRHAWSAEPWTVGARFPWPGRPAPLHPNVAGMQAVADLVVDSVRPGR